MLRRLLRSYARPFWRELVATIALSCAANAIALLSPAIVAVGLSVLGRLMGAEASQAGTGLDLNDLGDRLLNRLALPMIDNPTFVFALLAAVYVGQAVSVAGLNYSSSILSLRILTMAGQRVQRDLLLRLFSLPLSYFHRERTGDLLSRMTLDAHETGRGVGPLVRNALNSGLQVVGYTIYLVSTDVWLTLASVFVVGGHLGISELLRRPVLHSTSRVLEARAALSSGIQESLVAVRVVKSCGAEGFEQDRLGGSIDRVAAETYSQGWITRLEPPIRLVLDACAIVGIFAIAAFSLQAGRLSVQGLILYVYVGRLIIMPGNHLGTAYVWLQTVLASFGRVLEVIDAESDLKDGGGGITTFQQSIQLDHVYFSYGATPVIHDVSLNIKKGSVTAIVGPSGAGKSTLTDLVLRFYDPDQGTVSIDGVDIRELRQRDYKQLFGVVSQESLLFHDTIANNIRYGRDWLTREAVERAARLANAHGFIQQFPLGYDTVVGDRGIRLSGGERQRVALARAVAHEPAILVLDEATSALDGESERDVRDAIYRVANEMTTLVVAHRIATVLHADQIIVLAQGRVVDRGSHSALLERCELYKNLCALQLNIELVEGQASSDGATLLEVDRRSGI
jgi:subfamily B ATP-binding cassette protein MsbA